MDDISRDPAPDADAEQGPREGQLKGPAEVLDMAEWSVDDVGPPVARADGMRLDIRELNIERVAPAPEGPGLDHFGDRSRLLPIGSIASGPEPDDAENADMARAAGKPPDEPEPREVPDPPEASDLPEASDPVVSEPSAAEPAELDPVDLEVFTPTELEPATDVTVEEIDDPDEGDVPALTDAGPLSRVIFGLLLTTREALGPIRLAEVCNSTQKAVRAALERLETDLAAQGFPVELQWSGGSVRLLSAVTIHPYYRRLKGLGRTERLSPAALETLAVVAYRQPVIRAEIESVRGVKAGPMLRTLLDHKLVKVVGRADVPGRPLQYGTTAAFLDRFGLGSLKDLPSVQEFKSL